MVDGEQRTNQPKGKYMNKKNSKKTALTAPAKSVAGVPDHQAVNRRQDKRGSTQKHPAFLVPDLKLDDQVAVYGQSVTFGIKRKFPSTTRHRWFFNGSPIDAKFARALGVRGYDSPNLVIESADLINCGFYTYQNELPRKDGRFAQKTSATAQLWIARPEAATGALQTVVVVYGDVTPVGGHIGTCPGRYVSYARYPATKFANGGLACDGKNANNAVVFYGTPFTNRGCGIRCVNIPATPCYYIFCIFFKSQPPPGPYPLKLTIY